MKAVLVAKQRSGKQFLAACLSNHPDIHCHRDEPLSQLIALGIDRVAALNYAFRDGYYRVGIVPMTLDQALLPPVADYLREHEIAIIHLLRDALARATSVFLSRQEKGAGIPRHILYDTPFADNEHLLAVGPDEVLKQLRHAEAQIKQFYSAFAGLRILDVHYEALNVPTKESLLNPILGKQICEFLGVPYAKLSAPNHKMHKRPVQSYYARWNEIEPVLRREGRWPI